MSETTTLWLPNSAVRKRAVVPSTNARDLPPLNFLTPIYNETDEKTGRQVFGLTERDMQRVTDGYACPECLLTFERQTSHCPLCGHDRDLEDDIVDTPRHWLPSPATVTNDSEQTG